MNTLPEKYPDTGAHIARPGPVPAVYRFIASAALLSFVAFIATGVAQ